MSRRRKRLTPQQQQEHVSRDQFDERLTGFGWVCNPLNKDFGEDHVVQIFDKGVSVGLAFMGQLKSTTDLESLRLKTAPEFISYPIEVKDLDHWSRSTTLVVLIVWDVERRCGLWQSVKAIIAELRKSNPAWKTKASVCVRVPWANGTDDDGLRMLRRAVADHNLPLVPHPTLSRYGLSFAFPTDAEGTAAFAALRKAIDFGDPVKIDGKYISAFKYPAWYRRLYGETPKPESLEMSPKPSNTRLRVRIELDSATSSASVPSVELRVMKVGQRQATLTNEHQDAPLRFAMVWDKLDTGAASVKLTFTKRKWGSTVYEERDALAFMLASRQGGALRVVDLETGAAFLTANQPRVTADYEADEMARKLSLLEQLCFIQQRVAHVGTLSLANGIPRDDVRAIDYLCKILRGETIPAVINFSMMVAPSKRMRELHGGPLSFHRTKMRIKLLNLEIPVGTAVSTVVDPEEFARVVRERTARATNRKPVRVTLKKLAVREEFPDVLAASGIPRDDAALEE